jgi:hypothetical protein
VASCSLRRQSLFVNIDVVIETDKYIVLDLNTEAHRYFIIPEPIWLELELSTQPLHYSVTVFQDGVIIVLAKRTLREF